MTTVIADATPLIYLAAIGKFDLLGVLYERIVIPCAVYDEVVNEPVPDKFRRLLEELERKQASGT